ncbi:AraC family transcriptional regulator [Massilia endophytica]|uniref:AraC family transcriptional regulator n=1 Tax=Massilia endophytica TaxID=2899220 RepID=UPI001E29CB82|nr:AraC family transcriptional regulator [Massilia endophytica]UGQ48801.1 AraC family transcriptional regulator [Massilia endophytica]
MIELAALLEFRRDRWKNAFPHDQLSFVFVCVESIILRFGEAPVLLDACGKQAEIGTGRNGVAKPPRSAYIHAQEEVEMINEPGFGDLESISIGAIEAMFDALDDVAFFVKDREGRYLGINRTMVRRCGVRHKEDVIGKTALDLFPRALAETYVAQDRKVIESGASIDKHLELHIYPGRSRGWCITRKMPLRDKDGRVLGLIGTSRDLGMPDDPNPAYRQIAHIAEYIHENYQQNICLQELADQAGLSLSRVERLFQKVFHHSPRQLLVQCRLSAARAIIEKKPESRIADVAYECGYTDHSAFSRQFKSVVGMTPTEYGIQVAKGIA